MIAGRTYFGRFLAFKHIAADQTLPFDLMVAFPDCAVLDLFQIGLEAGFVAGFDFCDSTEMFRDLDRKSVV